MKDGFCPLCKMFGPLCDSHALPNSAFKYIFRGAEQHAAVVLVDDESTPLHLSSDSWDVPILCPVCERKLNENYDSYGIEVFKGKVGKVARYSGGVNFRDVDLQRLRMFFLSVLWRMSLSSHSRYKNIKLSADLENEVWCALSENKSLPFSLFQVRICKLVDSMGFNGFSQEHLRGMIVAPLIRDYSNYKSVLFLFFGFLVEIFYPALPIKLRKQVGMLGGNSSIFFSPNKEVTSISELMDMLVRALEKDEAGLSRL